MPSFEMTTAAPKSPSTGSTDSTNSMSETDSSASEQFEMLNHLVAPPLNLPHRKQWHKAEQANNATPLPTAEPDNSDEPANDVDHSLSTPDAGDWADGAVDAPGQQLPFWHDQDDLVITGLSGKFPESANVAEFCDNLFGGVDMVTENDRRWNPGHNGLPGRHGKLKEINRFDAAFFGVSPKQATNMDPQVRIMLEVVHEALVDSGVDPQTLRGSRTGVFIGCSGSETASALTRDADVVTGYSLSGCMSAMFANRISYSFDFRGPSFPVDTACSSSLLALQLAVDSMRQGHCSQAVVCGVNVTLLPNTALQFLRLGMLSDDGKCKSFDADGRGYVRAEGCVALFLQRSQHARRIYATVVNAKSNTDGFKEAGITVPSGAQQQVLLQEIYSEAGVDPNKVAYVEAHGTGTKVGDPQETFAISSVFCEDREGPLLIGSVKSNMGHAEPASGLCSIAKVLIAMEKGMLPPNLHYNEPNPYIPALTDGRMEVVTKPTPWAGGYVGVNSFGFGGANTHCILRSNTAAPPPAAPANKPHMPKIVCVSGRTEQSVNNMLQAAIEHSDNAHLHALLSEHANHNYIQGAYRGCVLLNRDDDQPAIVDIQKVAPAFAEGPRPVYFVYSGMGCQWPGMAQQLMHIDTFSKSVLQSSDALKPFGVDPHKLIMDGNEEIFTNTMHCMTCITAIQIGLTDVLRSVGVEPDGIIGHSTGEMACGYADGCLTRVQTMRLAYHRGQAVMNGGIKGTGSMAAVGLSWQQAKERCPAGVYPACHNGADSVTLSGDTQTLAMFLESLKKEDIFAKPVNSSGVPFHSPAMQKVKDRLLKDFRSVITDAKIRSSRWLSTSVAPDNTASDDSMCSAEYHVNNAMNPVHFYEAVQKIPSNAVTIEIGPHALLLSLLKRSLPKTVSNVGLCKAKQPAELEFVLSSLGKVHQAGVPIRLDCLYPPVSYPVPRGTPMIAPLVDWEHSQDWYVASVADMANNGNGIPASVQFKINPESAETGDAYLMDHIIDGRALYPFCGYVCLAWRAACKLRDIDNWQATPVILHDIRVHRATMLNAELKLDVVVSPGDGSFTVIDNGAVACSGRVEIVEDEASLQDTDVPPEVDQATLDAAIQLTQTEIYKELRLRGYEYARHFQGLHSAKAGTGRSTAVWLDNWVTFLDALLQAALINERSAILKLPTGIRQVRIDPKRHQQKIFEKDGKQFIDVRFDEFTRECNAGGVQIRDLTAETAPRRAAHTTGDLYLEKVYFVKHDDAECLAGQPEVSTKIDQYAQAIGQQLKQIWPELSTKMPALAHSPMIKAAIEQITDVDSAAAAAVAGSGPYASLLTALTGCDSETHMQTAVQQAAEALAKDQLLGSAYLQRLLKPAIDIALENTRGHELRAALVNAHTLAALQAVDRQALTHPLISVNWTVVTTESDRLQTQSLDVDKFGADTAAYDALNSIDVVPDAIKGRHDLIVLDRALQWSSDVPRCLQRLKELIRDDGFALVIENTSRFELTYLVDALRQPQLPAVGDGSRAYGLYLRHDSLLAEFAAAGLLCASYQSDAALPYTAYLLRRTVQRAPVTVDIDDVKGFGWIEPLKKLIEQREAEQDDTNTIWLKSEKTRDNGVTGLAYCLREEGGSAANRIRSIANVSTKPDDTDDDDVFSGEVVQQVQRLDLHSNMYRDGHFGSFRHFPVEMTEQHTFDQVQHAYINTLVRGDVTSLHFIESSNQYFDEMTFAQPTELVHVYFAPLNFRDVMLAYGRIPPDAIPGGASGDSDCLLGTEFAGRLRCGKRVMGVLPGRALATTCVVPTECLIEMPDAWTMQEASTVPVVYCTAYYALCARAQITSADSVLIHSGTGGVGQAAIRIALAHGCTVYTTVGSQAKRDFLLQTFAGRLQPENIFNSRSTQFERDVLRATKGRGVNVVLNSLSDDKLQASVRCMSQHGRFLEIGKFDLSNDSALGMKVFLKNITFHGILLDSLLDMVNGRANPDYIRVFKLLNQGIADGTVKPLNSTLFSSSQVEEAFRYMSSGKHMGKVVVQMRPEESDMRCPSAMQVRAVRRGICHPRHSYLITGGLGGFGLELANWLVTRGAKNLVLTSRSGVKTGYQARCVESWRAKGVQVLVSTRDIARRDETEALIDECQHLGPLGGVFHLAMVLRDTLFENQTVENFTEASKMKYLGTKNLDTVTRDMCSSEDMKWFVVFSSITSGRGNAGQTNYGWANCTMERVVEQRRAAGHCAQAIQWGAIGDVGVIIDSLGDNSTVVGGTLPQRMQSCLNALDTFLCWNEPIVSSYVRADTRKKSAAAGDSVLQTLAHIIGADVTSLNIDSTLGDLGIDSLMGVEIRQALERDYKIVLSMKDIRTMTLRRLQSMASGDTTVPAAATSAAESTSDAADLQTQMNQLFKLRIDVNELLSHEPLVSLNEPSTSGEQQQQTTFFVHSIEGVAGPVRKLCQQLNTPVRCFQATPDTPFDRIQTVAQHYVDLMRAEQPSGPYRVVGYSYGAIIGFEMAVALEALGERCQLVLLDSSHHYMTVYRTAYRAVYSIDEADLSDSARFQTELLLSVTQRFANADEQQLRPELMALADWDARVQAVSRVVMQSGLFKDADTFVWACNAVRNKFYAADRYEPTRHLAGDVTLLRAEQGAAKESDVGHDYGLQTIVDGSVDVRVVPGDHDSMVQGSGSADTAAVINSLFG